MKKAGSFFECRDLQFGLKVSALGACKSVSGSFARAIASLVTVSSCLFWILFHDYGAIVRMGETCGVENGRGQSWLSLVEHSFS